LKYIPFVSFHINFEESLGNRFQVLKSKGIECIDLDLDRVLLVVWCLDQSRSS